MLRVELKDIFPMLLGCVHRSIGAWQQRFPVRAVFREESRARCCP